MSTYDFTTLRPRLHMGASKWVPMERAGVTDPDVIPFSVADMDLLVAPEIIAAVLSCYYTYALRRGPLSLTRGRSGPADPP